MSNETRKQINMLIASVLTLAVAGNAFFIKRLVEEIDAVSRLAYETRSEVRVVQAQLINCRRGAPAIESNSEVLSKKRKDT